MPTQTHYSFRPVQGSDDAIHVMPYTEGYVYFATDTGKMYLDAEGRDKIPLGGGGAAVLYANSTNVTERADGSYTMPYNDLEDEAAVPKETDLIINVDGSFYKVLSADKDSNMIHCNRIAVSGTGGGGGGTGGDGPGGDTNAFVIKLASGYSFPTSFIYGQPYIVKFDVDAPTDAQVVVSFTVQSATLGVEPKIYTKLCPGKGSCEFDIGSVLPAESGLAIKVLATGDNDGTSNPLYYRNRSAIEMQLQESSNFNPLNPATGVLSFKCIPLGVGLTKSLKIYIDGVLQNNLTRTINTSGSEVSVDIPAQSHGMHKLKAILTTSTGVGDIETTPLEYEVAWVIDGETTPVIWLNEYPSKITDHTRLNIEYMVYDPVNNAKISINQYVNGDKLPTSPIEIAYNSQKWESWSIANYKIGTNTFTIECDGTSVARTIEIEVEEDTVRDLNIITSGLLLNLDSAGRSNRENITSRSTWEYKDSNNNVTAVKFNNFNWYNNGWISDENGDSCLRISNGASISIPLNVLGQATSLPNSLTFEFQFKVRNVSRYANLINVESKGEGENLEIIKTVATTEGIFGSYFNNDIGLCLGTQEAFFKSKNAIVNGRYMEDAIVNLTFVVEAFSTAITKPLMYIYINGVCSGIIDYKSTDTFDARATELIFNSDYCDVDLYKVRVYNTHLASHRVVHNYIADKADPILYDMNQICTYKNDIPYIDFTLMEEYNRNHPDNMTMPYAVLEVIKSETQTQDVLPFVKDGKVKVNVDFVNPHLDKAWEDGELTDVQYVTGSPSFHSESVEFDVQGTSSQGYPRRNYKGKWKEATVWTYTNGPLKGKSLADKEELSDGKKYRRLYLDNKDASERTFTWKADYMESSGTHNTGFASFVKTLYTHHPLLDYMDDYVTGDHRTTIYGFPMMVFHKHWDGTYEFVGKYNFNLDKGCNNVIDFENETAHPYVEGTFEEEQDDGTIKNKPLDFAHIAECWEVKHNQGGRTSFKKTDFDEVDNDTDKNLTILEDFEYRYHFDEDNIDAAMERNATVAIPGHEAGANFGNKDAANAYLRMRLKNLEDLIAWVYSTDTSAAPGTSLPGGRVTFGEETYAVAEVTAETWEAGKYFVLTNGKYVVSTAYAENVTTYEEIGLNAEFYEPDKYYILNEDGSYTLATGEFDEEATYYEQFINPQVYYVKDYIYYDKDTAAYRKAKFTAEFTKHFNAEYCFTYFIMTELLVEYDSRGKNMMLATWGPQEKGGAYIWYPIFYDIDTQLGVNNSGVPSWEYDVEPTKDNQFSTANSVLWNNLWTCFESQITAHYRDQLRKNGLNITALNGYYDFDPEISGSYAMRGCRPLNMINVDEYFKYIAPTFSGYINTEGKTAYDNGLFFYCLQGTRELQRELFLRNRFNFVDSNWLGGDYSVEGIKQGNIQLRWDANDYINTSDKFITKAPADAASNEKYQAFVNAGGQIMEAGKNYPLNADISFELKPHLKQYCSVHFDEKIVPTKFDDNTFYDEVYPVTIRPTAELQEQIDTSYEPLLQQLVYIGGAKYLSSLGDLSTKYVDEINIANCIRLRELILGNETPGYMNMGLKDNKFNLDASATKAGNVNANAKPLLETIVLTNLGTLTTTQDVSGSEKLKTFRALGTKITGVILADGTQIETLYLPNTISAFNLTEPVALNTLLTSKPVSSVGTAYKPIKLTADSYVANTYYTYNDVTETYALATGAYIEGTVYYQAIEELQFPKGLYIEGITDATVASDSVTNINSMNLIGGTMYYDSYRLVDKVVKIKQSMQANEALDTKKYSQVLALNLENINWTPYRLVEYGETIITGATYAKKTDHYTYETYIPGADWLNDTLNGRIYQVDTEMLANDAPILTDFSMLDTFINSYLSTDNWFRSTTPQGQNNTIPYVSGNIFINNTTAVDEEKIKNHYNYYFPDLNIFVKNVNKSYTAKFVEILDSGVEKEWGVLKFPTTTIYPRLPIESDNIKPSKLHYDFKGWVASPGYTTVLSDTDLQTEAYKFSQEKSVYTFYAYYEMMSYTHEYYNGENLVMNFPIKYNQSLIEPSFIPTYANADNVGFYERYAFVGWTDEKDKAGVIAAADVSKVVRDVASYVSTKAYKFYACYVLENVHEVATAAKYLRFEPAAYDEGGNATSYLVGPNLQFELSGKITLPIVTPEGAVDSAGNAAPAGKIISGIMPGREGIYGTSNFSYNNYLTHVFWLGGSEAQTNITTIAPFAFANCSKFVYFEYPKNITEVQKGAFANNINLVFGDDENLPKTELPSTLVTIGESAYSNAFGYLGTTKLEKTKTLFLPASLQNLGAQAFYGLELIDSVEIGTSTGASQLNLGILNSSQNIFGQLDAPYVTPIATLTVYVSSTGDTAAWSTLHDLLNMTYVASTNVVPV